MRFILTLDQLIAAGATAFAIAVGWSLGCWVTSKLLNLIKL